MYIRYIGWQYVLNIQKESLCAQQREEAGPEYLGPINLIRVQVQTGCMWEIVCHSVIARFLTASTRPLLL